MIQLSIADSALLASGRFFTNEEFCQLRRQAHDVFDKLWLDAIFLPEYAQMVAHERAFHVRQRMRSRIAKMARRRAYRWLWMQMDIQEDIAGHFSVFTLEECRVAYALCSGTTCAEVQRWARARSRPRTNRCPRNSGAVGCGGCDLAEEAARLDRCLCRQVAA